MEEFIACIPLASKFTLCQRFSMSPSCFCDSFMYGRKPQSKAKKWQRNDQEVSIFASKVHVKKNGKVAIMTFYMQIKQNSQNILPKLCAGNRNWSKWVCQVVVVSWVSIIHFYADASSSWRLTHCQKDRPMENLALERERERDWKQDFFACNVVL